MIRVVQELNEWLESYVGPKIPEVRLIIDCETDDQYRILKAILEDGGIKKQEIKYGSPYSDFIIDGMHVKIGAPK